MTRDEVKALVSFIVGAWATHFTWMTEDMVRGFKAAYTAGLIDLDHAMTKSAVGQLVRTSKKLPTVADIREAIGVVVVGERRDGIDAWGDLRRMRTYRDMDEMQNFEPLVLQCAERLDWLKYRTQWRNGEDVRQWAVFPGDENESSDRARFAELYDKLSKSVRKEAQATNGAIPKALPTRNEPATIGELSRHVLEAAVTVQEPES